MCPLLPPTQPQHRTTYTFDHVHVREPLPRSPPYTFPHPQLSSSGRAGGSEELCGRRDKWRCDEEAALSCHVDPAARRFAQDFVLQPSLVNQSRS